MKKNNLYFRHSFFITGRCISICFLLVFLCQNISAQNHKIDSLNDLISKAKTDTDRIKLNIKLITLISRNDFNTGTSLAAEQLQKAEKINYYDGIVRLRVLLVNNYLFTGDYKKAKENIHFLEKYIHPSDSSHASFVYGMYGMMYGMQAIYDSSILFYDKAISANERFHNYNDLPNNYANIAIGYQQLANYPMALKYQQKGLTLAQKTGNEVLEAKTFLNMAITYQKIGDTAKAIEYYLQSRDLAIKLHNTHIELYVYTNLATVYITKHEWDKAHDLAIKAAELAGHTGDIGIQATCLAQAVIALAHQNKFEEATMLSRQSIALADSSTQPLNIAQVKNAMGINLFLQKKYKEAIPYFEKAFQKLSGSSTYDFAFAESYKYLSKCYENIGNYKKALENYQIGVKLLDSMRTKDNIRKATELSMNYDFQKKQEVEKAEQKLKDRIARAKQIGLIVGSGILLLLAIAAFAGFRNKQKANHLLKKQKKEIETTFHKLKSAQTQLIQSEKMASLGELTAGIAHEIQNPLNFVNNFSDVNRELLAEMRDEISKGNFTEASTLAKDVLENEDKINHHGKRAGAIVKGMLQHSRSSTGQKEPVNINGLCKEYLRLSFHGIRAKDITFHASLKTDFDESLGKINIVPQDIGRVLMNLFNNAFYAVGQKQQSLNNSEGLENESAMYEPAVFVSTRKIGDNPEGHRIKITVRDNGNGIPQNVIEKVFQPFFTTKPTGEGTGLGLSLSYDIVKVHGGEIKVRNLEEGGAEFILELPIS